LCSHVKAAWLLSDIGDYVLWMAASTVVHFFLVMESSHLDHHLEAIWIFMLGCIGQQKLFVTVSQ
jgi:hypothetical protein